MNGVHTCDKRSTRSYIAKTFPQFDIEPAFSEEDELWREDHRETLEEITVRLGEALEEIFRDDPATCELDPTQTNHMLYSADLQDKIYLSRLMEALSRRCKLSWAFSRVSYLLEASRVAFDRKLRRLIYSRGNRSDDYFCEGDEP